MRRSTLRSVLPWVGLAVSAVFAYLAVRNVHYSDVWDGLRSSNYWWLIPAFAALVAFVYLKAIRWHYIFVRETRPSMPAITSALLVGYFFNMVLPARAGEAARVLALRRRAGTSATEAAATVVIERAYDVVSLLLILFVVVPWLPHVTWLHAAVALAVVLMVLMAVAVYLLNRFGVHAVHFALRPLRRLPFLSHERIELAGENLSRGLAALHRPRLMVAALLWTTAGWLMLALSMWFVMRGFHLGLSFVAAVLVLVATNLVQILPSSPAALGVFEAATVVGLGAYGISDSRALSYALVLHALNFIPFVAAGLLVVGPLARARRP